MLDRNKLSQTLICVLGVSLIGFLLIKYALWGVLPIILGWLISLMLYPLSEKLASRMGIPQKIISAIVVILFFCILIFSSGFALRRLLLELSSFAEQVERDPEIMRNAIARMSEGSTNTRIFSRFQNLINSLGEYAHVVDKLINNMLDSAMNAIGTFISTAAKDIVLGIPTAILFLITLIMSSFYFCVDRDRVFGLFDVFIPDAAKSTIKKFTQSGALAVVGYIKSSLILMLITFLEMLIFLTFLRVEYSLILSIIIAIVDVLPLLGVGAVLVPWSIDCFITSDPKLGIWLLVIFVASTVIRNIVEPKILGKRVGVHPFLIITSAYLGYSIFGGGGLLLGPLVVAAIFAANKEKTLTSKGGCS